MLRHKLLLKLIGSFVGAHQFNQRYSPWICYGDPIRPPPIDLTRITLIPNHPSRWEPAVTAGKINSSQVLDNKLRLGSTTRLVITVRLYYSETTWAVGIAQLTHHEVQGGGKNPETEGRWIFAPHRGPSGELIAQYRPPMSFCFYPTLYLGNHLYFLKPDSSWKQQKNTWISAINSVHSTKRVVFYGDATTFTCDVIMVPVVTRAPNITNISCWKIAPKPLVYIDPRILVTYYTFITGKTM